MWDLTSWAGGRVSNIYRETVGKVFQYGEYFLPVCPRGTILNQNIVLTFLEIRILSNIQHQNQVLRAQHFSNCIKRKPKSINSFEEKKKMYSTFTY